MFVVLIPHACLILLRSARSLRCWRPTVWESDPLPWWPARSFRDYSHNYNCLISATLVARVCLFFWTAEQNLRRPRPTAWQRRWKMPFWVLYIRYYFGWYFFGWFCFGWKVFEGEKVVVLGKLDVKSVGNEERWHCKMYLCLFSEVAHSLGYACSRLCVQM